MPNQPKHISLFNLRVRMQDQAAFAKAKAGSNSPTVAVQEATGAPPLVSKGLLALATLLVIYAGVVILNAFRGMLQVHLRLRGGIILLCTGTGHDDR